MPLVRGLIYTSHEGDEAAWECRAADREDGTLSFGGKTYELAGGRAFLLYTGESPARLVQLGRDLKGVEDSPQALGTFAKGDPEISAFLTAAGESEEGGA